MIQFSRNGVPQPLSGVQPPKVVTSVHHSSMAFKSSTVRYHGRVLPQNTMVIFLWYYQFYHGIFSRVGHLILGKIIKIVATSGQILRLKSTEFYFDWGSADTPLGKPKRCPRPSGLIKGRKGMRWRGRGGNVDFHPSPGFE